MATFLAWWAGMSIVLCSGITAWAMHRARW